MLSPVAYLRRPLAVMLLTAIVYQTGTCPCGCWDESLWRKLLCVVSSRLGASDDIGQLAVSHDASAARSMARAVAGGARAAVTATDEHECDDQVKIAPRDKDWSLRALRAGTAGWYCSVALPAAPLGLVLKQRTPGNLHAHETRANARAFFQVFLL